MPYVCLPRNYGQHQLLAVGSDPDGRVRLLNRPRPVGRAVQLEVLPMERDSILGHQKAHDLHALFQLLRPGARSGEVEPQLTMFLFEPGSADSELHAPA